MNVAHFFAKSLVGVDTWAMTISDLELAWERNAQLGKILPADVADLVATRVAPFILGGCASKNHRPLIGRSSTAHRLL